MWVRDTSERARIGGRTTSSAPPDPGAGDEQQRVDHMATADPGRPAAATWRVEQASSHCSSDRAIAKLMRPASTAR
jgi:hypothetical protein